MLLDGSLNILYLLVFVSIAFLWMPTTNNERYGLEQLPTDDYDESLVVNDHDEGPIKLRNFRGNNDEETDEHIDAETADEILAWAEENVEEDKMA